MERELLRRLVERGQASGDDAIRDAARDMLEWLVGDRTVALGQARLYDGLQR